MIPRPSSLRSSRRSSCGKSHTTAEVAQEGREGAILAKKFERRRGLRGGQKTNLGRGLLGWHIGDYQWHSRWVACRPGLTAGLTVSLADHLARDPLRFDLIAASRRAGRGIVAFFGGCRGGAASAVDDAPIGGSESTWPGKIRPGSAPIRPLLRAYIRSTPFAICRGLAFGPSRSLVIDQRLSPGRTTTVEEAPRSSLWASATEGIRTSISVTEATINTAPAMPRTLFLSHELN